MKRLIALIAGAALLAISLPLSVGAVPENDAKLMDGATFVTFGDSLTALSTWPQTVANELNMKLVNSGIGGNTSKDGMDRFVRDVANKDPDFVVIGFGTNDFVRPTAGNLNSQVSLKDFRQNLTDMITDIRALGADPILRTCPFVREDAYGPASNYSSDGGLVAVLDTYNEVIRDIASTENVGLIDVRQECSKYTVSQFLVNDGVHLSDLGNQVIADMTIAYMKDHYRSDPNAPRVPRPVAPGVEDGYWTKSIISFDPSDWLSPKEGQISAKKNDDGSISIANTTGLWPDYHYDPALEDAVAIPVEGSTLNFDFTTADMATNITLFLNGSTPTLAYDKNYVYLTRAIKKAMPSVQVQGDDISANQTIKGSIKLKDLIPKDMIDKNGNVLFSGVKIFAVGKAGQPVTIRELSVTKEDPSTIPSEPVYTTVANLLPTSDKQSSVSMNQGVVDVTYNQDGSLRLARANASTDCAWPSIAIALNQEVDLSTNPYLHLDMTPDGGSANGYINYKDENGVESSQQLSDMVYGIPNDFETETVENLKLADIIKSNGKITITKVILSVYGGYGAAVIWNGLSIVHEEEPTTSITSSTSESSTTSKNTTTDTTANTTANTTTNAAGSTDTTMNVSGSTSATVEDFTKNPQTGNCIPWLATGLLMLFTTSAMILTCKRKSVS